VDPALDSRPVQIAVLGDPIPGFAPQMAIEAALGHSAATTGSTVEVTWHPTSTLAGAADVLLSSADAVWCAPGSPYQSLTGALAGIRFAREHRRPFLGTCAGFQHAVIEVARSVLGIADAAHEEYEDGDGPMFISELLCSLVGQTMTVRVTDPHLRGIYETAVIREQYYCRFGLRESYLPQLATAGLVVAGTDAADGGTRILRLMGHPFYYLTLFVPQTSSSVERPHPLVTAYLAAARAARPHTQADEPIVDRSKGLV
jgi:CTP synthase (UTP-ammonia lyase)